MKKIIFILLFQATLINAQTSFIIDDFSSKFYAKIFIDDSSNSIEKFGKTTIYKKTDNTVLIAVDSVSYIHDFINNKEKITDNGKLKYSKQSLIIFDDFNFDKLPDIAIFNGNYSCYSGPSYEVYLYKNNQFEYNQDFTNLVINNCGFFEVNTSEMQLATFTKSGCCFHSSSKYKVVNDFPVEIEREESTYLSHPSFLQVSKYKLVNDSLNSISSKTFYDPVEGDVAEVLSFELEKNKKKVVVFSSENFNLNYVLLKSKDEVEFNFPVLKNDVQNNTFTFTINLLSFTNKKVKYEIFQEISNKKITKIGINIYQNGKKTVLNGITKTIKGNLNDLQEMTLENLILKSK